MEHRSRKGQRREESAPANQSASAPAPHEEPPQPGDDLIARRAYQRYEERGREDGRDLEDWLSAEQELGGMVSERTTRTDGTNAR
jgi:hypothetical protein